VSPVELREVSDDEWVRKAASGDRSAYSALVRRHERPLHRFLLRMVGSPEDAMELSQEAFVRAWQALATFEPEAQFRTWLYRIASNAALDLLRRRRTVEFVPMEDAFEPVSGDAGPERRAEVAQEVRRTEAGLARLSVEHREILLLREVEDMSYEEIGQVLSLSPGTVKSRLARARAALVDQMKVSP
jgi:RNA polymerase sigma-70 factor (ECF subfamily)